MSMKLKIALYNTFLVSLVMILVLVFMMSMSSSVIFSGTKTQLKFLLHDNVEELYWRRGELMLDDVELYENHITTLVYTHDGYHIAGYISNIEEFSKIPLTHGEVTTLEIAGTEYLIYDFYVDGQENDAVFLRGIASVLEVSATVETLFFITVLTLPLFILFAGMGSYAIAYRSMKPLELIIETAQDISHGDDLSRRIDLGAGKDEIHELGDTFDIMFSKLEEAFIAEKRFSSDVSHELRTPTAVILAECECTLQGEVSHGEQREALLSIQRQGKKMQQLITALLNLIRLDNGVHKANFVEVDVSELVELVCEEQESLLEGDCTLEMDIPQGILATVDYGMLIRVLSNLIDNGFKYGKEGGYVKVSLEEIGSSVRIMVKDNGIGIPKEHLGMIFRRLYQVDSARNQEKSQSMGLGLAMVEQIVKLHGGSIAVDSVVDVGSCFTLILLKQPKEKLEVG